MFPKVISVLLLFLVCLVPATGLAPVLQAVDKPASHVFTLGEFVETKNRDLGELLGQKLRWKERFLLGIVKRKTRKMLKKQPGLRKLKWSTQDFSKLLHSSQQRADERIVPGTASLSFVLGLLSFLGLPLLAGAAPLAGLLAIIFGFVGLGKIRRQPERYKGNGFAWAGLLCGFLSLLLISVLILAFIGE